MIAEYSALLAQIAELTGQLEASRARASMWRERCAEAQLAVAQMGQLHQEALAEIEALQRDNAATLGDNRATMARLTEATEETR